MNAQPTAPAETGRFGCLTEKVRTPMGSVFVHIDVDARGRAIGLKIDQAQKFEDTAVGELLDAVARAATALMA